MNGRNYRLTRIFDSGQNTGQTRLLRWLAKFFDIGTGDEGSAFTVQYDRLRGIPLRRGDGIQDAFANRLGQGIHRRVIYTDYGDIIYKFIADYIRHNISFF